MRKSEKENDYVEAIVFFRRLGGDWGPIGSVWRVERRHGDLKMAICDRRDNFIFCYYGTAKRGRKGLCLVWFKQD